MLHVAARTDMHGCTGAMFEWWFRWRCDTQKHVWWHPVDHVFSDWRGDLRPDTHVGSEHVVTERLADLPAADLSIPFRDPVELFGEAPYAAALAGGAVSAAVCARITELFPDHFGRSLLQHAYNEFTFLSRFLPSLYIAEHRDEVTPDVPW